MILDCVVEPTLTDTVCLATSSSFRYRTMVYVPGFIRGEVKDPLELASAQY